MNTNTNETYLHQAAGGFGNVRAFTLIELVAILAVVAVMASLLVPSHAQTRTGGQGSQCMANTKTLMMANLMYQFDNRDALPMTFHGGYVPTANSAIRPWVTGWLDWSTYSDNTNLNYLLDPRYGSLAVYFGRDKSIYKCPADIYAIQSSRRPPIIRVRSVSGNFYVGKGNGWATGSWGGPGGPNNLSFVNGYRGAAKSSDLLIPGPARTWVYMDEHPDSMNDGGLWSPNTPSNMPDAPANYHDGAAGIAMADGHSEMHRWTGPTMNKPRNRGGLLGVSFVAQNNYATVRGDPDLYWLAFTTPRWTTRTVAD